MRALAIGLAIALIVFVATAGHVVFLPLLFVPLGLFSVGHRRRNADRRPFARRGGFLR
jgi:hypothetical protein